MGGKSSPPPPDYGPLAAASERAAELGFELGSDQLALASRQYDEAKPYLQAIANQQLEASQQQQRQANDYYNYNVDTFRPVEQGLVQSVERFNSEAYQEQLANRAAADAGQAFNTTRQANERSMASMGVNPNSGRFQGLARASELGLTAQRAGAMTGARNQAEQLGYARRLDVTGLGRGLPGASTAAYQGALNAGNSAGANFTQPGQQYIANQAQGVGTIQQGQATQMQGLGNILNAQTNAYINGGQSSGIGAAIGGLAGIAGAVAPLISDRRLKENIKRVGQDEATGLDLYEFNYIADPGRRFVGVMADEVEVRFPEAILVNAEGFKMVRYGLLGLEMRELV